MKIALILIAILLEISAFGFNDHVEPNPVKRQIACQIVDAATGEALTGVQVSIDGTGLSIWSDEEGKIILDLPPNAQSTLTCSLVSFETVSLNLTSLQDGAIVYLSEK